MPYSYSSYDGRGYGGGGGLTVNAPYNRASLVGFWPMNESSGNALDLGPNGLALTVSANDPGTTTGVGPYAASHGPFVAASNHHYRRTNPSEMNITGGWTLVWWVKRTGALTANARIVTRYTGADANSAFALYCDSSGTQIAALSVSGTTQTTVTGIASTLNVGEMWMLSKAAGSSALRLSLNGGATVTSSAAVGQTNAGALDFAVGEQHSGTFDLNNVVLGAGAFWLEDLNGVAGAEAALYNSGNGLAYYA